MPISQMNRELHETNQFLEFHAVGNELFTTKKKHLLKVSFFIKFCRLAKGLMR